MMSAFRFQRYNQPQLWLFSGAVLFAFLSPFTCAMRAESAPSPAVPSQAAAAPRGASAPKAPAKKVAISDFTSLHFSKVFPSNFVPIYPGATANSGFTNSTKGPPAATTTLSTNDEPEKVLKWYTDYFNRDHWALKMPFGADFAELTKSGKPAFLNAQKDDKEVSIIGIKSKKTAKTVVTINWMMNPNKPR